MAEIIETGNYDITKERRIFSFTAVTKPNTDPSVLVVFGEVTKVNGEIVNMIPETKTMTLDYQTLTGLLPNHGLPDFATLYNGLGTIFHEQYNYRYIENSGKYLL